MASLFVTFLLSLPKRAVGVVLDRLLGPVEDFEYVSTTSPEKPPTIS